MYRRITLTIVAVVLAMVVLSGSALANNFVVKNPGKVTFTVEPGSKIYIGPNGITTKKPGKVKGQIDRNGTITIPKANLKVPSISFNTQFGTVYVHLVPLADGTGSLNPSTGAMTLSESFAVNISGNTFPSIPKGCAIRPITFHLTTGKSGNQTGTPYNSSTGNVTLVDGLFSVPGASNCGSFWGPGINYNAHLPSPSGSNYSISIMHLTPIIH